MVLIESTEVVKIIRGLLRFPYPQICRHSVALDLLSLLEASGAPISQELADAVVCSDDASALRILNGLA
jgi:hypothetical protein